MYIEFPSFGNISIKGIPLFILLEINPFCFKKQKCLFYEDMAEKTTTVAEYVREMLTK